jgi:hypothetical protein
MYLYCCTHTPTCTCTHLFQYLDLTFVQLVLRHAHETLQEPPALLEIFEETIRGIFSSDVSEGEPPSLEEVAREISGAAPPPTLPTASHPSSTVGHALPLQSASPYAQPTTYTSAPLTLYCFLNKHYIALRGATAGITLSNASLRVSVCLYDCNCARVTVGDCAFYLPLWLTSTRSGAAEASGGASFLLIGLVHWPP